MSGALLITADRALGKLVRGAMSGSGIDVAVAEDSDAARRALVTTRIDAVLADAVSGDVSETVRVLQGSGRDVPLAVIAGEATRLNRWRLPGGATQVFRRPLDLREVRRSLKLMVRGGADTRYQLPGGAVFDAGSDTASVGDRNVVLTGREAQVLQVLAAAGGAFVPTDELMVRIWSSERGNTDSLRTHVRAIRAKLASIGAPDAIETRPRHGYRLRTA